MTTTASTPRRSATRTREVILTALGEVTEPVTVTDLAELAGVGKSTLAKHLPALEKDELAVRTPGGRDGRRRLPDTWQAATSTAPETASDKDIAPQVDRVEEEIGTSTLTPDATAADTSRTEAPGSIPGVPDASPQKDPAQGPGTATATAPTNDQSVAQATPTAPDPARLRPAAPAATVRAGAVGAEERNPVSGSTRLAPGELKLMVKAILDASPEEEFTATAISHLLQGRSIGAIQNNLARLAKEGKAVQTCDRPRRYRSPQHPA